MNYILCFTSSSLLANNYGCGKRVTTPFLQFDSSESSEVGGITPRVCSLLTTTAMAVSQQNCSKKSRSRWHLLKNRWMPKEQYSFVCGWFKWFRKKFKMLFYYSLFVYDSLGLHCLERCWEHESLYTKGIIQKDVRRNSWRCFTLRAWLWYLTAFLVSETALST